MICTTCTLCHFLVTNNISSNILFIYTSISKIPSQLPQLKAFLKRNRNNQRIFEGVAAVATDTRWWKPTPCPKDRHPNRRRTAPALPGSVSCVTISEMRRSTSSCSWQPATVPPRRDRGFPRCWLVIFKKKQGDLAHTKLKT